MQRFPEVEALTPAAMARSGLCVGCGTCARRMRWDSDGFLKPEAAHHRAGLVRADLPLLSRSSK